MAESATLEYRNAEPPFSAHNQAYARQQDYPVPVGIDTRDPDDGGYLHDCPRCGAPVDVTEGPDNGPTEWARCGECEWTYAS